MSKLRTLLQGHSRITSSYIWEETDHDLNPAGLKKDDGGGVIIIDV